MTTHSINHVREAHHAAENKIDMLVIQQEKRGSFT